MGFEYLIDHLFKANKTTRGVCRLDMDEAALLYKTVRESTLIHYKGQAGAIGKPFKALEIGRFYGGSTILMAHAMNSAFFEAGGVDVFAQNSDCDYCPMLYSIDKAPKDDARLLEMWGEWGFEVKVELLVGNSTTEDFPSARNLDLVFIDGGHSYDVAKRDHIKYGQRVWANGRIVHHDMSKTRPDATQIPDLARLRNDILQYQSTCSEILTEAGSLCVFRKKGGCWRSWS